MNYAFFVCRVITMNIISPGQLSPGLVPLADVRAGSYLPSGDCGRLGAGAFLAPAEDNCMTAHPTPIVIPLAEDNCRRRSKCDGMPPAEKTKWVNSRIGLPGRYLTLTPGIKPTPNGISRPVGQKVLSTDFGSSLYLVFPDRPTTESAL